MFEKVDNDTYICKCGNNRYQIQDDYGIYEIFSNVTLECHEWGGYDDHYEICLTTDQRFYICESDYQECEQYLKYLVELFNKQIATQIEQMYSPGGQKYIESEKKIQQL